MPNQNSVEPVNELATGITTRVFAKKLQERRLSNQANDAGRKNNQIRRNSFLYGTTIPNSTINRRETIMENDYEYDELKIIDNIIKQYKRKKDLNRAKEATHKLEEEQADKDNYDKIQKDLRMLQWRETRASTSNKVTPHEVNSEDKTRINRRTTADNILIPETSKRRLSNIDSIRQAISNVDESKLLNVESLEDKIPTATEPQNLEEGLEAISNVARRLSKTLPATMTAPPEVKKERLSKTERKSSASLDHRKSILKQSRDSTSSKKRVSIVPKHESFMIIENTTEKE